MRATLSPVAAQLLRALITRMQLGPDKLLVSTCRSVDWQSLTFTGERHEIRLRIAAPDAEAAVARLSCGLAEAEWSLRGHVVADIAMVAQRFEHDGAIAVDLEALTLSD
jgi:hypothetical protein